MGRAKATLPLEGGDTFLTRIVRTFLDAGVADIVVVVGYDRDAIAAAFDVKIGTVYSRLHAARSEFRSSLARLKREGEER